MKLKVNFEKSIGKIKAMHAVGQPPFYGIDMGHFRYLTDAKIPYSRLHDTGGPFGKNLYVDIPNLFRDFDADENDPASYDFDFTDLLLSKLMEAGVKPYFRLGVTIENYAYIHAYRIYPPKDVAKWARICEHVIRHYNEGWANGFTYGIEYWEIWNEPEGHPDGLKPCMWLGTKEEYFELYRVAAAHLKKCFGDTIKVGGYASCGFSALLYENAMRALETGDTANLTEREAIVLHRLTYFKDFLKMVKEYNAPIDFFSWHSYDQVEGVLLQEKFVENALAEAGLLGHIEIHLNEWNTHHEVQTMGTSAAAAHTAAMMCGMQDTKLSILMYYDARLGMSNYGGMFDPRWRKPFPTYDAFLAFGALYALETQVEVTGADNGLYATAASDGKDKAILIANIGEAKEISLNLSGEYFAYAVTDDTRMKPAKIDPAAFTLRKETFVFFTTKEIEIPQ